MGLWASRCFALTPSGTVSPGIGRAGSPSYLSWTTAAARSSGPATAGFRRQGSHPFAVAGDHVYVCCEGDADYRGARPHPEVTLWKGPAAEAARRLRAAGDEHAAQSWRPADQARRSLDEEAF